MCRTRLTVDKFKPLVRNNDVVIISDYVVSYPSLLFCGCDQDYWLLEDDWSLTVIVIIAGTTSYQVICCHYK